jgi:hypothetical protein
MSDLKETLFNLRNKYPNTLAKSNPEDIFVKITIKRIRKEKPMKVIFIFILECPFSTMEVYNSVKIRLILLLSPIKGCPPLNG